MFGHQDNNDDQNPALPPEDNQPQADENTIIAAPINHPLAGDDDDDEVSLPPTEDNHPKPAPVSDDDDDVSDSAGDFMMDDEPAKTATDNASASNVTTPTSDSAHANDLLDIKQNALQDLSPLVDHLDQTPEEKFRTTMMMIQASDNQSLIKVAYDAAKAITDEKERAQALLDIVNEINYFTQNSATSAS